MSDSILYFQYQCEKGLEKRGLSNKQEYIDRYNYEFDVISKAGFCDYFLIIWDIYNWCKRSNISVGYGRGCLTKETLVFTSKGYVPLNEIEIGDLVYTHTGKLQKVNKVFRYPVNEDLLRIKTNFAYKDITLTKDHKVLGIKVQYTQQYLNSSNKSSVKKYKDISNNPEWVAISELKKEDYLFVSFPIRAVIQNETSIDLSKYIESYHNFDSQYIYKNISLENDFSIRQISRQTKLSRNALQNVKNRYSKIRKSTIEKLTNYLLNFNITVDEWINTLNTRENQYKRFIPLDENFYYVLGRWIGDGWIGDKNRSYYIGIAFNSEDTDGLNKVQTYFNNLGFTTYINYSKTKKLAQLYIYDKILVNLLRNLFPNYKDSSNTKYIGQFKNIDNIFLKSLLCGIKHSDGFQAHTKGDYRECIDTTSFELMLDCRECLLYLHIPSSISIREPFYKDGYLCKRSYKIRFRGLETQQSTTAEKVIFDNGYYVQIQDIQTVKDNFVYDIETNIDHSYLTNNFIVHNSVAGSLIAYLLEITQVDPIKYNLYFERFINPGRLGDGKGSKVSPPDIDCDIDERYRDRVIEYVISKYGKDRVAHVGTYGTVKAKGAIKDVCRTLGYDYSVGDKLAALTLPPIEGKPQSLSLCFEKVAALAEYKKDSSSPEGQILYWAEQLENNIRSIGVHASGVIISSTYITDIAPTYIGKDKISTLQYDMWNTEEVGLIKFDFLGLSAVSTISICLDLIKKSKGIDIKFSDILLDDRETYNTFSDGDVLSIFQFTGSQGILDLTVNTKPICLEDLALINSLFRPGPLSSKMPEQFLRIRNQQEEPNYLFPELEPILSETSGVIVYQEQVMRICRDLAGFSLSDADVVRKALGKKVQSLMDQQKIKFIEGMIANGFDKNKSEELFNQIIVFASYSFNKSHGLAYSLLAYVQAYLKTHYKPEWICASMISDIETPAKLIPYINYCKQKNINLYPPDINESDVEFSVNKSGDIQFALGAIKHVSLHQTSKILTERSTNGEFLSFLDFISREKLHSLNKKIVESLIYAGAFDKMESNRNKLIKTCEAVWSHREELKRYFSKMETYNDKLKKYKVRAEERDRGSKKNAIKLPVEPEKPILPIVKEIEDLSLKDKLSLERNLLGFYISGHPIELVDKRITSHPGLSTIATCIENKDKVSIIGVASNIKEITTKKKKQKMVSFVLEDQTGTIEASVIPTVYPKIEPLLSTIETIPYGYKGIIDAQKIINRDTEEEIIINKFRVLDIVELPMSEKKTKITISDRKIPSIDSNVKEVNIVLNNIVCRLNRQ